MWMICAETSFSGIFSVVEITTDEGMTFNGGADSGTSTDPLVPKGFNNVTSYSFTDGITTSKVTIDEHYQSLPVLDINTQYVIQPSQLTTTLYSDSGSYLNAGANGMSLSTGINKTTAQAADLFRFQINNMNFNSINDGIADFFSADIARNQSADILRFLDAEGNLLASFTVDPTDWTQELGYQTLDRWDLTTGTYNSTGASDDDILPVNAIALELSEFELETGVSWQDLADHAAELQVEIPSPTKTDYAFLFAVDSRDLNVTSIPEPATAGFLAAVSLCAAFIRRRFWN